MENKKVYRNDPIITLKESQLNDIIYYACLRASQKVSDNHYRGIAPFFYQLLEEGKDVLNELEFIKSYLKMDVEKDE
jgi:hypothetical protein